MLPVLTICRDKSNADVAPNVPTRSHMASIALSIAFNSLHRAKNEVQKSAQVERQRRVPHLQAVIQAVLRRNGAQI